MRVPTAIGVAAGAIVFIATGSLPRAEFLSGTGPRALSPALVRALKRDRCAVLAAAIGPSSARPGVCEKVRLKSGDLPVRVVAMDGEKEVELLKRGDRCPGGYVGADIRSPPAGAGTEWLELTLTATDEKTMTFQGYAASPVGELAGCGPAVEGRIRLTARGWRLAGPRQAAAAR